MSQASLEKFLGKLRDEVTGKGVSEQDRLDYNLQTHNFTYNEDTFIKEMQNEMRNKNVATPGINEEVSRLSKLFTKELDKTLAHIAAVEMNVKTNPLAGRYDNNGTDLHFVFTTDVRTGETPNNWAKQGQQDVFDKVKRGYHRAYMKFFFGMKSFVTKGEDGDKKSLANYENAYVTNDQNRKGQMGQAGHAEGEGVVETQMRLAFDKHKNKVLSKNTGNTLSEDQLLKDLKQLGIELDFMRDPITGKLEFNISLIGAGSNNLAGSIMRGKKANVIKKINKLLGSENTDELYTGLEGSDTQQIADRKMAIRAIAKEFKKNKKLRVTTENTKIKGKKKKANIEVKGKGKKGNAVAFAAAKIAGGRSTGATKSGGAKPKFSIQNILGVLNAKLPEQVAKNMGSPRLENVTGRFAQSVRAVDINSTSQGHPSIGYTYRTNPYKVYESTSGSRFSDANRDPRSLIDKSVREIVAQFGLGRLYTRRV